MQTFLPHRDFRAAAEALDTKRLGKQRVEVIQIVRALTWPDYAWKSHPAVLMWKGFEEALGRYGLTCCEVWVERGFADTCAATIAADLADAGVTSFRSQVELEQAGLIPGWLDDRFTLNHRSKLVGKLPEHYEPQFPGVPGDQETYWPVRSPAVLAREAAKARRAAERAAKEEQ